MVHFIGFKTHQSVQHLIFLILFMVYCVTICGNLLIITLVSYGKTLHSPMYFFLSQLSLSDILIVTDILPNTLHAVLVEEAMISFSGCIIQFYFFAVSEVLQCFLLTAMAFDRYLAICKPLHYTLIMSHQVCWMIVTTFWILSMLIELIFALRISKLQFCGPNIVDHFFCDFHPIVDLSCFDTTSVELEVNLVGAVVVVIPFTVIIVSYIYIIVTIFNIPSITGRQKVFSTCSSHLTVVSIYYGTMVCVYLVPSRGQSLNVSKLLPLLYTVVTPLMNPIIYSLRNKDLKKVIGNLVNFLNLQFRKNKCS
ncbi:unnamed protein product [Staurois parvus]|uniref:G-protein coupled receptors family 1 profile domain-containing protein n=1 Tax=Staurois parvus TaxID=386267 RepID=A0ABN9D515_9NEOB|nr:unnamed protein product [Staurois parvus]